ncbi:MAG: hypothetical protein ACE5QV_04790, partial [Fidelibacterota bacterium]
MYKKILRVMSIAVITAIIFSLIISCERKSESLAPEEPVIEVNAIIIQGPANEAVLVYNSSPTFKWKGEVSPGYITGFKWKFINLTTGDTLVSDWSMDMQTTFPNLTKGDYYFEVAAKDNKDSVDVTPDTRSFSVAAADNLAPVITVIEHPTDGSKKPPGASVFFSWTGVDSSLFGSVVGYSYRLAGTGSDATDWSDWDLNTTSIAFSDLHLGSYTFMVVAKDNSGLVTVDTPKVSFSVIEPTVLIVDDDNSTPDIATDDLIHKILRDYSWADWDISTDGYPSYDDIKSYSTVVWYVDASPYSFYYFSLPDTSSSYIPNPLIPFLDDGNNLWLMGGEILYFSAAGDTGD